MPFPKVRLTINPSERSLIIPGLDIVVSGLAVAKVGAFPHRHPYDRIDLVCSALYEDREYDDEMAARLIALRSKLSNAMQSMKIRVDSFDLAAIAFVVKLWKAHKPSDATEEASTKVKPLQAKLERYRLRARRAAIKKIGKGTYLETAERWRRFAGWTKYNLLYFKLPSYGQSYWAKLWREERRQLTLAFATALTERFFEVPSDIEMVKLVTLSTRSLKRSRHPVSFSRELLRAPQSHTDFLVAFAVKRMALKRLPGAPVSALQAASNRADAFRAFEERRAKTVPLPSSTRPHELIAGKQQQQVSIPVLKVATSNGYIHDGKPITGEIVCDAMAEFLYETVTVRFGLTREVCEQAQLLIRDGCLDNCRVPTTATSFRGLLEELRPPDFDGHRIDVIVIYAEWLLKALLALRQNAEWMYRAFGAAWGRAKRLEEKAVYDEWTASRANRSQVDAISA